MLLWQCEKEKETYGLGHFISHSNNGDLTVRKLNYNIRV